MKNEIKICLRFNVVGFYTSNDVKKYRPEYREMQEERAGPVVKCPGRILVVRPGPAGRVQAFDFLHFCRASRWLFLVNQIRNKQHGENFRASKAAPVASATPLYRYAR